RDRHGGLPALRKAFRVALRPTPRHISDLSIASPPMRFVQSVTFGTSSGKNDRSRIEGVPLVRARGLTPRATIREVLSPDVAVAPPRRSECVLRRRSPEGGLRVGEPLAGRARRHGPVGLSRL